MMINSGISKEEVLNSFIDLSGKPIEKSPGDTKKTKKIVAPSNPEREIKEEVIEEVIKEMQE